MELHAGTIGVTMELKVHALPESGETLAELRTRLELSGKYELLGVSKDGLGREGIEIKVKES
ncbi:MAG TPA: hypothetical protein VGA66_01020 [Mycobacterium sp.]